jgi:hypothetical protein
VYEEYFLQRLLEELELAQQCEDPVHRRVHEQACEHYRRLLRAIPPAQLAGRNSVTAK